MTLAVRQESPPAGPLDVPELVQPLNPLEIGIGAYTDIVAIDAPAEAEAGQTVNIQVAVKNLHTTGIYIACMGRYNGNDFAFSPEYATVYWGQTQTFTYSFPMPSHDITLDVWSFYWADPNWYEDDHEYVDIKLKAVAGWRPLDSATVRVNVSAPPVVGWQLLDSATVGVNVGAPPVVGWQALATISIGVTVGAPPVTGWLLLATTTVGVAAGPLPPEYELIQHVIDPWAYFYEGDAETASITFTLIKGTTWLARDMANRFAEELAERGSQLLEGEFYKDASSIIQDRYLVKVSYVVPAGAGGIGAIGWYIPPIVWNIIFYAALGALVVFLVSRAVNWVKSMFYSPPPLSEDVKREWQVEDPELIPRMIIALRPEYTPEELAGKTDQELLDILDEIYEEEVPGKGWPWYIWATIAGVGIAGSWAAVTAMRAFARKKGPEKKKEAVE